MTEDEISVLAASIELMQRGQPPILENLWPRLRGTISYEAIRKARMGLFERKLIQIPKNCPRSKPLLKAEAERLSARNSVGSKKPPRKYLGPLAQELHLLARIRRRQRATKGRPILSPTTESGSSCPGPESESTSATASPAHAESGSSTSTRSGGNAS